MAIGGSCITTLLRDTKNAAVESGAAWEMVYLAYPALSRDLPAADILNLSINARHRRFA